MTATITENENLPIGHFTPFNDSEQARLQPSVQIFDVTQGYDTEQTNRFRQGVNLRLPQHLFKTTQPKVWSGRLDHQTRVVTIGQARSFVEYDDSTIFKEKPEFNPVWFIQDRENYPYPIIFNNGPQQEEEASVEPFTIPMRKKGNEGPFYPRSVKASLEDGNGFDDLFGGTTRVEQFIDYNPPLNPRYFLDEGQSYFGAVITDGLLTAKHQPIALYQLTSTPYFDAMGNNPNLVEAGVSTNTTLGQGPFPDSLTNPSAAYFDGVSVDSAFLSSSATSGFPLPTSIVGDLTVQCYFTFDGYSFGNLIGHGGTVFSPPPPIDPANNILYAINFSLIASTITYRHQYAFGSNVLLSFPFDNFIPGSWNHLALTRTVINNTASVSAYLNGVGLGTQTGEPPTHGQNTKLTVGVWALDVGAEKWPGSISSVKIHDRSLSALEIFLESRRLFDPIFDRRGAIIIEGFTPVIIRNLDPFDDTRDERIVERLQTTDPEFIAAVKQLDFDLDKDIRETFARKSATAGGDVYGLNSAIYGTDSIAFRGVNRGG